MEGTRTRLLETITEWFVNPNPETPRFFWLNGMLGTGKTTVACTIAKIAQEIGFLGAQFRFSRRGESELRDPRLVFPTIAYQLSGFDPDLGRRIINVLETDFDAPFGSLKDQLQHLIIQPLSGLERDPKRIILIVFDAFDECEASGAGMILRLLLAATPSLPPFLKIFVTARPEAHVTSVLVPSPHLCITALHDIDASVVRSDMRLFLRTRLHALATQRDPEHQSDWVTDEEINFLTEKSDGLFLYATSSINFVSEGVNFRQDFDNLIEILTLPSLDDEADNPLRYLDQRFREFLGGVITPRNLAEMTYGFRPVVGSITLLREPLPADAFELLVNHRSHEFLSLLRSVIILPASPDQGPKIYHPSFLGFLRDRKRCIDPWFHIDTTKHEALLGLQCLEILNTKLHKRMLGDLNSSLLNSEVEDLEYKVAQAFALELRYASRHWASHVVAANENNFTIVTALETFAATALLPWMEEMSWLGELPLCLTALEAINVWVVR